MSSILALDTCFEGCSAAALSGDTFGTFSACENFQMLGQGHSERLMAMIGEAMSGASAQYPTLMRIGVTVGPGTFTGTRIGIAAARALALATSADLVGISSLLAIAWRALHDGAGTLGEETLLVCMDARRDQVYCQLVGSDGDARSEPLLLAVSDAAKRFADQAGILVGTGAAAVAQARTNAGAAPARVLDDLSFTNLAGSMLPRLAVLPLSKGPVRPLYLRPPDAKPQAASTVARTPVA